jgi:hypothetical protein
MDAREMQVLLGARAKFDLFPPPPRAIWENAVRAPASNAGPPAAVQFRLKTGFLHRSWAILILYNKQ